MIKILKFKYNNSQKIELYFSDGSLGIFNLTAYLANREGVLLTALHDEAYAKRLFIDAGALCWPNGLELSPIRLHDLTKAEKVA